MFGVDYAFSPHPSILALRSAKAKFVVRYISNIPANDHNGKNLVAAEARALKAARIGIVVVVEYYAKRMLEGQARGREDALHADSVVKSLGMPGLPIYFAADWDASPADQPGMNAYLEGAASAIGVKRVGLYGGYYPIKRSFDAGKIAYGWQTYAWSGGLWDSRAQLRQYRNSVTLGGASVDYDESAHEGPIDDFGQWPRPKPKPSPKPKPGPFRHEADGKQSLRQLAKARKTTVDHLIEISFANMDSVNKVKFAEYLAGPGADEAMPVGLVYWTTNP